MCGISSPSISQTMTPWACIFFIRATQLSAYSMSFALNFSRPSGVVTSMSLFPWNQPRRFLGTPGGVAKEDRGDRTAVRPFQRHGMRLGVFGVGLGGQRFAFRVRRTEDERQSIGVGLSGSHQPSGLGKIDVVHDRMVRNAFLRGAGETQADALELAAPVPEEGGGTGPMVRIDQGDRAFLVGVEVAGKALVAFLVVGDETVEIAVRQDHPERTHGTALHRLAGGVGQGDPQVQPVLIRREETRHLAPVVF